MSKIIQLSTPAGGRAIQLRFTVEDMDRHGNVRLFVRRNGRKLRLRSRPGTPEFLAEYNGALAFLEGRSDAAPVLLPSAQAPRAPLVIAQPESFLWLVRRYLASGEYRQLHESTQVVRRRILEKLCQAHGGKDAHKPYAQLEAQHVAKWRDAKIDAPEAGNSIVKAVRAVFDWAMQPHVKLASANPARDVPKLKPKNPDGHHTWTVDEVGQYIARHPFGTKAYLALAIFLFTGVRISDACRLGRQMERDGWLHFTEVKGAGGDKPKPRELPILPQLRAALDGCPTGDLTWLVSEHGVPFRTAKSFGNKFRDWCVAASLPHCSAHGLRKAGATIAADQGASTHALMAIFGWTSTAQAELYTRRADRRRLTAAHIHLLAAMAEPLPATTTVAGTKMAQKCPTFPARPRAVGQISKKNQQNQR